MDCSWCKVGSIAVSVWSLFFIILISVWFVCFVISLAIGLSSAHLDDWMNIMAVVCIINTTPCKSVPCVLKMCKTWQVGMGWNKLLGTGVHCPGSASVTNKYYPALLTPTAEISLMSNCFFCICRRCVLFVVSLGCCPTLLLFFLLLPPLFFFFSFHN